MSVCVPVGVVFEVWIDVLECIVIDLGSDIEMLADVDANIWAVGMTLPEFLT